jgi:hypothetical protein
MSCDGVNLKPTDTSFRWLDVLLDRVRQIFGNQYIDIAARDTCAAWHRGRRVGTRRGGRVWRLPVWLLYPSYGA